MKDQPKTPGAMVLVERDLLVRLSGLFPDGADNDGSGRLGFLPHVGKAVRQLKDVLAAAPDHIEDARAMVELPPGWPDPLQSPMAEAIRSGHYDDTEFRALFDRMEQELSLHRAGAAARMIEPAEQTPAVGGDIAWRRRDSVLGCKPFLTTERYERSSALMKSYYEPFTCAQVAPLLARIAALEAQQGEAVAIGTLHRDCDERIVFESSGEIHIKDGMDVYARPITAKLEMADIVRAHLEIPQCPVLTSNQCHSLAVKLNAVLSK